MCETSFQMVWGKRVYMYTCGYVWERNQYGRILITCQYWLMVLDVQYINLPLYSLRFSKWIFLKKIIWLLSIVIFIVVSNIFFLLHLTLEIEISLPPTLLPCSVRNLLIEVFSQGVALSTECVGLEDITGDLLGISHHITLWLFYPNESFQSLFYFF